MPFQRTRKELVLADDVKYQLQVIAASRSASIARVERARILLAYAERETVSAIARSMSTNRPRVERCIDKALQVGALAALEDLVRPGKPPTITPEAKTWLISLACEKPTAHGYPHELWTLDLLAGHARKECEAAGHPSLIHLTRGTVCKILRKSATRPHKITYYVERRDPEFDSKMAQVLYVYKQVQLVQEAGAEGAEKVAYLSYDDKPGVQAVGATSPDRLPVAGRHPTRYRDYEYVRYGTLSLLAGIDLMSGHIHGLVRDQHRSTEFIEFLQLVHDFYDREMVIRIVLDNGSAHTSRETRAYLATVPGRFEFIFTPTHGSWLNLIETFFSKLARTMLRGIRVNSKEELADWIRRYLDDVNESPVVFRWKRGLDAITITPPSAHLQQ